MCFDVVHNAILHQKLYDAKGRVLLEFLPTLLKSKGRNSYIRKQYDNCFNFLKCEKKNQTPLNSHDKENLGHPRVKYCFVNYMLYREMLS